MDLNYTEEQLTIFTEKEKALLGKTVIAIKDLDYGCFVIKKGNKGIITDFGKTSGDPLIYWNDLNFKGFASLDNYILVIE